MGSCTKPLLLKNRKLLTATQLEEEEEEEVEAVTMNQVQHNKNR